MPQHVLERAGRGISPTSFSRQIVISNARLLRSKVSKYAVYGVLIAAAGLIVATLLASYFHVDGISPEGIISVQKSNIALWLLDAMPLFFAFWGQYTSSVMAYEAGALVVDQTHELRAKARALEFQIARNATHDRLTELPNRMLLLDRLEQAIVSVRDNNHKVGLFNINVDRFKEINETLGYKSGDLLLKQIAARLGEVIGDTDTLARLDGDEFAVLLPHVQDVDALQQMVAATQAAMVRPFLVNGLSLEVQNSIGAALFPDHGSKSTVLLQYAEVAMNVAKQEQSRYVLFSPELGRQRSPHRLTLIGELRQAITANELELFYQPKLNVASGRVDEAEALVRWRHRRHGLMQPDSFIPLAEQSGLIRLLTHWVLTEALRQSSRWRKQGIDIALSINLSAQDLSDQRLPATIADMLRDNDVPPSRLVLEITETSILVNHEHALRILEELAAQGVRSSIDDFGTGYSSLSYLKQLPASELKIDKSFVTDMLENENDAVIVRATIDLAHNLGLKVIAEGVEADASFQELKRLGCDLLQGYIISPPRSADDFRDWLKESPWA